MFRGTVLLIVMSAGYNREIRTKMPCIAAGRPSRHAQPMREVYSWCRAFSRASESA
jgi:hypothetical protein